MSKMLIILVIYFVNSIVSAEDSSDETKYIDLLPEKEKDDFLERIARRIFDKAQSKDDRDRDSGEVSEAQIDEHDEFVKKILEEESMNFRKSDNVNNDDSENENIDTETKILKDDDEYLEKKDDHDAIDDAGLVDLTLRDSKRNKRNSIKRANENSKIIHVTGNGGSNAQNNGIKHSVDQSVQDTDGSDREDIQIKYSKHNMAEGANKMDITTQSTSDLQRTQMIDFDVELEKNHSEETVAAPIDHIDGSPNDAYKTQENMGNIDNINILDNDNDEPKDFFGSTQKIYEILENKDSEINSSERHGMTEDILSTTSDPSSTDVKPPEVTTEQLSNLDYITTEVQHNISDNARFLRSNIENMTMEPVTKTITNDGSGNDDAKKGKSNLVDTAKNNDFQLKTNLDYNTRGVIDALKELTTKNSNLNTTDKFTPGNTNKTVNKQIEIGIDVDSTTLKTEVLTETLLKTEVGVISDKKLQEPIENHENTLKPDTNQVKHIVKELNRKNNISNDLINKNISLQSGKTDKNSMNLANDMIKVLRTQINPEPDSNERNFNGLRELYENMKPNEYNVYEVSSDKQPFIQKDHPDMAKENAYYVPIYNYSPENAYYNPHNRLGPNADDEDKNIIITNDKIDGDKDDNNQDLDKYEKNPYENDRDDTNLDLNANDGNMAVSNEFRDNNNKVIEAKLKSLIKIFNNNEDQRKFRFGNTKPKHSNHLAYKVNLPVVVSYPKFTDIYLNPNDYLDMDYSYGRTLDVKPRTNVRNRCESDDEDKKKERDSIFPDSTEKDHPRNNMHEESLKNHIRAVRQLLYKQKNFGFIKPVNSTESVEKSPSEELPSKLKKKLRTRLKDTLIHSKNNANKNNIAMDYFFGRMNEDAEMITKELIYLNSPKETQKNLNNIAFSGNNYPKNYIKPAIPAYTDELTQYYSKPKDLRIAKEKENVTDYQTIKQVLSIANEKDLITTLDKLLKLNLTTRTRDEIDVEPYVTVLEDMVRNSGRGLKQYDWLGTTVDIQSALMKLMDMIDAFQKNAFISQPDLQLLKYTVYLLKSVNVQEQDLRMTKLPRNRRKKKGILKESGLFSRQWLIRKLKNSTFAYDTITKDDLNDFNKFLFDLQYYLYDLHTAIQQIANITKFNNQRWFENLKELYFDTNRKNLLELLLHMTTARLLDLVEKSARNGLEEDFLTYVMKNEKDVERTKQEFWFALKIIEEFRIHS